MGLAVRAGKVSFGHDAVKLSIRSHSAAALLFTTDASARLREELQGLAPTLPVYELTMDAKTAALRFGKRAAVLTVNDPNFSNAMKKLLPVAQTKEETPCL